MRSMQLIDRLHFDQETIIDHDVDAKSGGKAKPVKLDVHGHLPRNGIAHSEKLAREHRLVNGLQQTGTKLSMQLYGRIEDVAAYPVYVPHPAPLRLCVSARIS